jgi:hypothetical protein
MKAWRPETTTLSAGSSNSDQQSKRKNLQAGKYDGETEFVAERGERLIIVAGLKPACFKN